MLRGFVCLSLFLAAVAVSANCCDPVLGTGCSPIIINFERGGYRLTGADAPVWFDIGASGASLRIGWTAARADEAFLWLDRNSNGAVDDGAELFGTATVLSNGTKAPNGFVALAEFDENQDLVIDAGDLIWSRLLLWRDLNHDAISQPEEIASVAESTVRAVELAHHWSGRRDQYGNQFKYESAVWVMTKNGRPVPRPVYDVFFVAVK